MIFPKGDQKLPKAATKNMLGHRDLNMTARYSHLAPDTLQEAVKGLERRLNEQGERRAVQGESNVIDMPSPA